MQKIIITGATGIIGSSLAKCALAMGMEVLCIVRQDSKRIQNLPESEHIKIVSANLSEYADLIIPDKYDTFFHLAWDKTFGIARDDVDVQIQNVKYTLDAVRLAQRSGCTTFIGAGSQAEYGPVTKALTAETPVNPESGYGIAKYTAGKLSALLCTQLGICYNWVRILSVFGPKDTSHTLVMYVIHELLNNRSPQLTKCEQLWDYLYCDDAAKAFLSIGLNGINGKIYPLGSGSPRLLSDYLKSLQSIINPAVPLLFGLKDYYPHQSMYLCADISQLMADTGWQPTTSFEDGIKNTIDNLNP